MRLITKETYMKLPVGKKNVLYTIVKAGYAHGVTRPRRIKTLPEPVIFNPPVILRKAS
jgi:hypothetical protein